MRSTPAKCRAAARAMLTTSPNNRDLYCGGHVEVPAHCNPIAGPLRLRPTMCVLPGGCGNGGCASCDGVRTNAVLEWPTATCRPRRCGYERRLPMPAMIGHDDYDGVPRRRPCRMPRSPGRRCYRRNGAADAADSTPVRPAAAATARARRLRRMLPRAGHRAAWSRRIPPRRRGRTARRGSRSSCVMHPARITRSRRPAGRPCRHGPERPHRPGRIRRRSRLSVSYPCHE